MTAVAARGWPGVAARTLLVAALAAGIGALGALQPLAVLGLAIAAAMLALAFQAPVTHFVVLLVLTAIVPYSTQNRFGVGGGSTSAGLLLSDLLLITGLVRASVVLADRPVDRRQRAMLLVSLAFLALAVAQFAHGVRDGVVLSDAGAELRVLLGFGAGIVALPMLHDAAARRRLIAGLAVVGLLLGAWGLAQRGLGVDFGAAKDVGVRKGVTFTSATVGSVQGGLYAFGVAAILAFAALASGTLRARGRLVAVAIVVSCSISLLFTYERTFWVTTMLGLLLVAASAGAGRRARATASLVAAVALAGGALALTSPGELSAAAQRLTSIAQAGTDNSLRTRNYESRHVVERIRAEPLGGSGLGSAIFWGQPWERKAPRHTVYTHNGYLWAAWKLGVLGAALLVAALIAAMLATRPVRAPVPWLASGARAGLMALLLASFTFPAFNTLSITPVMGLLAAACVVRRQRVAPARSRPSPAPALAAVALR
jgi:O-antigen ligase/polysaccharide polymerase Wzy-like membrane protein